MRSSSGFFLVHRRMFSQNRAEDIFYGDAQMQSIWLSLLAWANWKDSSCTVFGQDLVLERGEVLTSLNELTNCAGCSISATRRRILKLKQANMIRTKTDRGRLIVTILNYSRYQDQNLYTDEQPTSKRRVTDEQANKNRHHDNKEQITKNKEQYNLNTHTESEPESPCSRGVSENDVRFDQANTNPGMRIVPDVCDDIDPKKNASELILDAFLVPEENLPKKKKRNPKVIKSTALLPDIELAQKWATWSQENWVHQEIDILKWSEGIAKARTKTVINGQTLDHKQMDAVFEFIKEDNFFKKTIRSPCGLLGVWSNGETKIVNVLNRIKEKHFKYNNVLEYARRCDAGEIQPMEIWS